MDFGGLAGEGEEKGASMDKSSVEPLTESIIGAAIAVHRALGPGLLESVYEACLVHELQ